MEASNQFAASFLQEAAEQLALIEDIILEIEKNPADAEALNRMFRVFHTIKGSGSMFGFDTVAEFTHHVETLLDKVRAGRVPVSTELVNTILAAKDHITLLLKGPEGYAPDPLREPELIARLNGLMDQPAPAEALVAEPTVAPCSSQTSFHIRFTPEPAILARGIAPATLLGDLRKLGECDITARTDAVLPLEQFTPDVCSFYWDITLTTNQGINAINDVFIFVADESQILIEPLPSGPLPISQNPLSKPAEASASTGKADLAAAAPATEAAAARKAHLGDGSVRVPSERLNRLVNLVGELVINQSRLSQIAIRMEDSTLSAPTEDLERLVGELRDIVLGIRMMPIGATFNRFKRLVRDLSAELGKEINLVTEGEETELDKTVIDQLGDPLVHLIRNAVDHGIATPEQRQAEGKPAEGTIRLTAHYEGANVIVTIEDDGRGLDKEAIRAKAIEKKLITADKVLSESELF